MFKKAHPTFFFFFFKKSLSQQAIDSYQTPGFQGAHRIYQERQASSPNRELPCLDFSEPSQTMGR